MVEINLLTSRDNSKEKYWRILFIVSMACSLMTCWVLFNWMQRSLHQAKSNIYYLQAELKEKSDKKSTHQRQSSIATTTSLSQLKLAGYMEKDNFFWSLIMLPNGETHEVQTGSVIGKENGLVLKLSKNEMVIQLENGEMILIT